MSRVGPAETADAGATSSCAGQSDTTIPPLLPGAPSGTKYPGHETRDEASAGSSFKFFLRVFLYNDALGWALNVAAFICMVGAGIALPLMDVVFGGFVNIFNGFVTGKLTPDDYMGEVGHYTLYFVYIFIGKFCLTFLWTLLISISAVRTTKALRVDFFRQTLRQEISFFDTSSLSVSGQITTNGNLINGGISEKLGLIIQAISMFVSAFVVAFIIQWKLTLITLAIIPANAIVTVVCIHFDAIYEYQMFDIYAESGSLAQEAFSTIRTAHAFWAFPKLTARFNKILGKARQVGNRKSLLYAILFPVEFFSVTSGYALAFWQGMRMYSRGEIQNPGTVVTVIFAVLVASQALTQIAPQIVAISKAMAAARDFFSIIDRKSSIDSMAPGGKEIPDFKGDIKVRGVHFSYPSRSSVAVLADLNLDMPSGKTTALVGASGSGKSTIFALLERWYDYSAGDIMLDDYKLEDINIQWLRTNIRLVQQEPTLFSGTIFQNVVDGLSSVSNSELTEEGKRDLVIQACQASFAHDFIQDLPHGYDTWVGERGASLSGGQKQRIVIARSIISNPKVLLLDEATSALDPKAERIVQAALNNVAKGRTTVIIAHKLSTVRDADNIVVMAKGQILESGTHYELLQRGGAYTRLVRAQDLGTKSDLTGCGPDDNKDVELMDKEMSRVSTTEVHNQHFSPLAEAGGFFRKLLLIIKEQRVLRWPGFVMLLCCVAGGGTYPVMAVLFSKVLNTFETIDVPRANFFALMFFIVALGNLIIYAVVGWLSNVVSQTIMEFYRGDIFTSTLRQDMPFFDKPENATGALVSRLASEPTSLQELLSMNIVLVMICIVNLVSSCILAIAYGWKLGLVLGCGALPFIVGSGYIRIRLEFQLEEDTAGLFASSSAVATEAVMGIRTISSLALERLVTDRYSEKLQHIASHVIGSLGYKMLFFSLSQSISLLAMGLGFWYGGKLVSTGEYTSSQFYIIYLAIVFSGEAAAVLFQYTTSITKAGTAMDYILRLRRDRTLFDAEQEHEHELYPDLGVTKPRADIDRGMEMQFDKVRFSYPLRPDRQVLHNISIQLKSGKMVAFVGASGCGKSTLVALLERFYDPSSGSLSANGKDVRSLDRCRFRRDVALVQQEPVLYQGTIRENVSLGIESRDPSDSQIIEACQNANIWGFVSSLPSGLDTPCGNQGLSLSGGQRQRIAIARALIRKPKLLLLDEATSALDTESEKIVKEALDRAAEGRTTVAVAHRLSTIRDADVIIVFAEGRIVEMGNHDELLNRGKYYYEMVLGQSLDIDPR